MGMQLSLPKGCGGKKARCALHEDAGQGDTEIQPVGPGIGPHTLGEGFPLCLYRYCLPPCAVALHPPDCVYPEEALLPVCTRAL